MKKLGTILICALLAAGLTVGCDSEGEATPEPQAAVQETSEVEPDDGEVIADDDEDVVALEGGQWVESELYDVKFRVPEDWVIRESDDALSATDSDDSTTVILAGSESETTLQQAMTQLRDDIQFKDVHFESNDLTTISGFAATRGRGSAVLVREGEIDEEIQFLGYAIRVGSKNVTMLIFSEATMYEAKRDIIDGIAHTLVRR